MIACVDEFEVVFAWVEQFALEVLQATLVLGADSGLEVEIWAAAFASPSSAS